MSILEEQSRCLCGEERFALTAGIGLHFSLLILCASILYEGRRLTRDVYYRRFCKLGDRTCREAEVQVGTAMGVVQEERKARICVKRNLLCAMRIDELKGALRRCGLRVSGLKEDMVDRLLHVESFALTEEACVALQFVGRCCDLQPDGYAFLDDASAYAWIEEICLRHSAIQDVKVGSLR